MMSSEVSILKLILNNMAEHFFDEVHFFLTQASLSMKNSQFLTEISEICVLLNPNIIQALKACKEHYFLNGSYKFRDISTFANKLDLGSSLVAYIVGIYGTIGRSCCKNMNAFSQESSQ